MSVYENAVEEIKSRCNIVDVIGQVVTLKKRGATTRAFARFITKKHLLLLFPKANRYLRASAAEPQGMCLNL